MSDHLAGAGEPMSPENSGDASVQSPPRFSLVHILWPILLSLTVLLVIGHFTFDLSEFRQILPRINPWLMAFGFATVATRIFIGGLRLRYVSHGRLTVMAATRGQLAWDFASNMTPSLVGGAPLAAFYISRDSRGSKEGQVKVGEVTAWMVFVMVLDQIWFALCVPFVLISGLFKEIIPSTIGGVGFWTSMTYFVALMLWTIGFAYATLFRPQFIQKLVDVVCRVKGLRRFRSRAAEEMKRYGDRAKLLRSQPLKFYLHGFLLTSGTWLSRYFLLIFLVWSVTPGIDVYLMATRTVSMTLGSLVMPTPGGAGGIEGLFMIFISPLLVKSAVVPILLVWRILAYYVFLALGVVVTTHTVRKHLRHRKLTNGVGNTNPVLPASTADAVDH